MSINIIKMCLFVVNACFLLKLEHLQNQKNLCIRVMLPPCTVQQTIALKRWKNPLFLKRQGDLLIGVTFFTLDFSFSPIFSKKAMRPSYRRHLLLQSFHNETPLNFENFISRRSEKIFNLCLFLIKNTDVYLFFQK